MKNAACWVALSVLLLCLAPAANAGEGRKHDGEKTIQGCLAAGEGENWYVLTKKKDDGTTKEIKVQGNDSFAAHVGHEVKLTGSYVEGDGGKHFAATAMQHVAATCG
jgi:ribosome maturation factor RimP